MLIGILIFLTSVIPIISITIIFCFSRYLHTGYGNLDLIVEVPINILKKTLGVDLT